MWVLQERILIFFAAFILASLSLFIGRQKGFYRWPAQQSEVKFFLRDVLGIFGLFLFIELFLIPSIIGLWLFFSSNYSFSKPIVLNLKTQGWLNLMMVTSAAFGVISYCFFLTDKKKRSEIFWNPKEPHTVSEIAHNLGIGAFTWFMSFPFIVMVSQLVEIAFLSLDMNQHVDQVAVKNLKLIMQFPLIFTLTVLLIVSLVPISEEILFRGFLQKWAVQKLGRINGILCTSFLFAFFHFSFSQKWDNVELLLSLFILSCFLGFIYEKQRTLWASIGLHMTFNAISVMMIIWQQV
jgi:uncharacterized protein